MGSSTQDLETAIAHLIEAAKERDPDAALRLIERCESRIVSAIQIAGVSPADPDFEDAQNLALFEIWKRFPDLKSETALCAWMHTIAKRVTASRVIAPKVRQRERNERYRRHQPADAGTQSGHGDAVSQRDLLARAFAQLSIEHREVLVLRFLEGMSEQQTADLLQIPVRTVSSRTSRAKRAAMDAVSSLEEMT